MEIIPVIDLMGGIVVHAQGGEREHYPPLQSALTVNVDPEKVVADMLAFYPFKLVYVADLDAIFYQRPNIDLYKRLVKIFPQIIFWLDAGVQTLEQWRDLDKIVGIVPVIGSETLTDLNLLATVKQGVLSLDFQHGQFLGKSALLQQPERWPNDVIVMNLDYVGEQSGLDYGLLSTIQKQSIRSRIIAAGGVRNQQDLIDLEQQGISRVLVASALHSGMLNVELVKQRQTVK